MHFNSMITVAFGQQSLRASVFSSVPHWKGCEDRTMCSFQLVNSHRAVQKSVIEVHPSGMPNDLGKRNGLERVAASGKRGFRAIEDPGE